MTRSSSSTLQKTEVCPVNQTSAPGCRLDVDVIRLFTKNHGACFDPVKVFASSKHLEPFARRDRLWGHSVRVRVIQKEGAVKAAAPGLPWPAKLAQ